MKTIHCSCLCEFGIAPVEPIVDAMIKNLNDIAKYKGLIILKHENQYWNFDLGTDHMRFAIVRTYET